MLRKVATVFGMVFIVIGILGFIPGVTVENNEGHKLLLNLFMVGTVHNLVHLASGIVALLAAAKASWSRWYFQIFGIIYAIVTIWGFLIGEGKVLGFLPVNMADNFLHLVIAAIALYFGFLYNNTDTDSLTTTSIEE